MNRFKELYSVISLATFASLAGLLFGYDTGIISGAILYIQPVLQLNNSKIELVVSSVLLGAFSGALFNSYISVLLSRRRIVFMTAFQFMIGSVLCAAANSLWILMFGRFLLGIAIGISSYVVPMYIAEVAPARFRGALVAFNTIAVTFGMLLAYCVSYLLSSFHAWRLMLALGFMPAFLLAIGIYLLPESPRWLIQQGQRKLGKDVLSKLRSSEEKIITKEYMLIEAQSLHCENWQKIWQAKYRLPLAIGVVLALLQQFCGINSVLYYTPMYLTQYHLVPAFLSLLITIGIGFTNLSMTIVAVLIVDKLGRRQLLLWGLSCMVLFLFLLSHVLPLVSINEPLTIFLVLIFLFAFIASYAVSIGCIFWIVISEIYPLSIRNSAMGFTSACNWIGNMLVSSTFLTTIDYIGISNTLLIYAGFTTLGWLFCYFFLPETARFILEESSSCLITQSNQL